MQEINFSVLIPVYNSEEYLPQCIESVLNQSFQGFEIILVNDGSTDGSAKLCQEYGEKDLRIKVCHQENQGQIAARMKAWQEASKEYCLYLDADDYWDQDTLETIKETILEYRSDLVIFKFRQVSNRGALILEGPGVFPDRSVFEGNKEAIFKKVIKSTSLNSIVCKAFKRELLEGFEYAPYKGNRNAEDLLQSLPLLYEAEKIVFLEKALYNYRESPGSVTRSLNTNFFEDITLARAELLKILIELGLDSRDNLRDFYNFYIEAILDYLTVLINANLPNEQKRRVMASIPNLSLYKKGGSFFDHSYLSFINKIRFFLFERELYNFLIVFEKLCNVLRCFKNLLVRKETSK